MRFEAPSARLRVVLAVCVTVVAAALAVSGCGGSGSSSSTAGGGGGDEAGGAGDTSSAFPAAVKANEAWEQRPTSIGLKTPVAKPVQTGKVIDFIQCAVPACAVEAELLGEATELLGWKLVPVDAGSTPEEIKVAYAKAVRDQPDGVIGSGYPLAFYESEAKELEAMGIPVVESFIADEAKPGNGLAAVLANNEASETQAKMMADYVLAHSNDKSMEFGIVNVPGLETIKTTSEAVKQTVESECPGCQIKELDAPVTSIGKDLSQRISGFLTANPGIEWTAIGYGDMVTGLPTTLKGAGVTGVNLVTTNINPTIAPYLADGEYLQATVGTSAPEIYWRVVDTLVRIFNHESLAEDLDSSTLPYWTITSKSLPSTSEEFPLVANYQEQFEKLWGIS